MPRDERRDTREARHEGGETKEARGARREQCSRLLISYQTREKRQARQETKDQTREVKEHTKRVGVGVSEVECVSVCVSCVSCVSYV
jgi:ribosomal protein S12 methylthiotransferase accessory factor YcaO